MGLQNHEGKDTKLLTSLTELYILDAIDFPVLDSTALNFAEQSRHLTSFLAIV